MQLLPELIFWVVQRLREMAEFEKWEKAAGKAGGAGEGAPPETQAPERSDDSPEIKGRGVLQEYLFHGRGLKGEEHPDQDHRPAFNFPKLGHKTEARFLLLQHQLIRPGLSWQHCKECQFGPKPNWIEVFDTHLGKLLPAGQLDNRSAIHLRVPLNFWQQGKVAEVQLFRQAMLRAAGPAVPAHPAQPANQIQNKNLQSKQLEQGFEAN